MPEGFPDFSLKIFRVSFCQMNLDKDPEFLPDVSYALGHKYTSTTERFYRRIRQGKALKRIQDVWETPGAKNP